MKDLRHDQYPEWLASIIAQDFSEEELKELDALIHEVREEIWLEQQDVQKPIIVSADTSLDSRGEL